MAEEVRRFELQCEKELRVEVSKDESLKLRVASGTAEIFGTELPVGIWLTFAPRERFAVFTWKYALLELNGKGEAYIAVQTPMLSYVNVHGILDNKRRKAQDASSGNAAAEGPRVMIVGPPETGKSSLTKMLLGWALKKLQKPMYVDLDVAKGSITIPGAFGATVMEMPFDPVQGLVLDVPVVYFFGHTNPRTNGGRYKDMVGELADCVESKFEKSHVTRTSGMIINTMGCVDSFDFLLLRHAIDAFKVNVILVLEEDKLYRSLSSQLKGLEIVRLSKSEGVGSSRPAEAKDYFYGRLKDLTPFGTLYYFKEIQVFEIDRHESSSGDEAPAYRVTRVPISMKVVHSVLAVSYAKEPEDLPFSNVAGFISVSDVDLERETIRLLQPGPGSLPNRLLILGSIYWIDSF